VSHATTLPRREPPLETCVYPFSLIPRSGPLPTTSKSLVSLLHGSEPPRVIFVSKVIYFFNHIGVVYHNPSSTNDPPFSLNRDHGPIGC
jgi:hypothetical protein